MKIKSCLAAVLLVSGFAMNAQAACEETLRAFHAGPPMGSTASETLVNLKSPVNFLYAVVGDDGTCVTAQCRLISDALWEAYVTRRGYQMGVDSDVCFDIDRYTLGFNMGGSCDVIPLRAVTSFELDPEYADWPSLPDWP